MSRCTRTRTRVLALVAVVLLAGAGLAAGCGNGDEAVTRGEETTATTETTTAPSTTTDSAVTEATEHGAAQTMKEGHDLYVQAGCGGCHGENGEGTEIGPALPGHGEDVVIRQVRSPLDQMPAYTAERLSDEDLHEIAEYIAALAPEEEHIEPVKLSDLAATHHWMALAAIDADSPKDALHHVDHIIELVKGKHLAAMKEAREHLEAGDAHEAEHLIQEMLAGTAKPELGLKRLHLRLALSAVEARDAKEALHEMRHFVALAKGAEKAEGREAVAALSEDDLHEGEHAIERLLGESPHDDD